MYEHDRTQGPACAVAAGAGTIYRNWFAPVGDQIGQTADVQIDCLADLGVVLDNTDRRLWEMQNGYCFATEAGLAEISGRLVDDGERERLMAILRIGTQHDAEVTISGSGQAVTQAYCSAMPVAYSSQSAGSWEDAARLILDGACEATLRAAAQHSGVTGNNKVFLTLLGGGVFGNPIAWIIDSIERAFAVVADAGLDIAIVSYGS